eukprot:GAHX01001010.1.p1 GENE.GAHX01001010.1~~GAHX01001010.1.p1  ORF type:complete len:267 (+),score=42.93 GAHX01001010.1:52-852(+)
MNYRQLYRWPYITFILYIHFAYSQKLITPADFDLDEGLGFIALENIQNIKSRTAVRVFLFSSTYSEIIYMPESRSHPEYESFKNIYQPKSIVYLKYLLDDYEEGIARYTLTENSLDYEKILEVLVRKSEKDDTPKTPISSFKGILKVYMKEKKKYDLTIENIEFGNMVVKICFRDIVKKRLNYLASDKTSHLHFETNVDNDNYIVRLADKNEIDKIVKELFKKKDTPTLETIAFVLFICLDILLLITVVVIFRTMIRKQHATELVL